MNTMSMLYQCNIRAMFT